MTRTRIEMDDGGHLDVSTSAGLTPEDVAAFKGLYAAALERMKNIPPPPRCPSCELTRLEDVRAMARAIRAEGAHTKCPDPFHSATPSTQDDQEESK